MALLFVLLQIYRQRFPNDLFLLWYFDGLFVSELKDIIVIDKADAFFNPALYPGSRRFSLQPAERDARTESGRITVTEYPGLGGTHKDH